MPSWRKIGPTWCNWPAKPKALIEMIGGSYLSIKPELSYKRLLSGLLKKKFAIHSWSYIPNFDHQIQANQAWRNKLDIQTEFSPSPIETLNIINKNYIQENNLLIKFKYDNIDQTEILFKELKQRINDNSKLIEISGDHLTPVKSNIKEILLDQVSLNPNSKNDLEKLIETISEYALE